MSATTISPADAPLEVCSNVKIVTLFCSYSRCGRQFEPTNKRQRFCSVTCRVYNRREPNHVRRNEWLEAKMVFKSMAFDGRIAGPANDSVGLLRDFKMKKENANDE